MAMVKCHDVERLKENRSYSLYYEKGHLQKKRHSVIMARRRPKEFPFRQRLEKAVVGLASLSDNVVSPPVERDAVIGEAKKLDDG